MADRCGAAVDRYLALAAIRRNGMRQSFVAKCGDAGQHGAKRRFGDWHVDRLFWRRRARKYFAFSISPIQSQIVLTAERQQLSGQTQDVAGLPKHILNSFRKGRNGTHGIDRSCLVSRGHAAISSSRPAPVSNCTNPWLRGNQLLTASWTMSSGTSTTSIARASGSISRVAESFRAAGSLVEFRRSAVNCQATVVKR